MSSRLRVSLLVTLCLASISALAQSTSLSVSLGASPNPVQPGQNINYTITVSTEGPDSAANAALTFTPPPTTAFQSFSGPAGWSCITPGTGTTNAVITCTNPLFAPGSDVFFNASLVSPSAPNGSQLIATASVTTTTLDPDLNDNLATATVTVQFEADLSVDKTGPATVIAGDTFAYTITVQNLGPNLAENATMTDTLDANLQFVSINDPGGWTCGQALGVVTCTNPSFATGTAVFTLTVQVPQLSGGSVTNDVTVSTTSTDPVLPNNQDSLTSSVVTRADLSVTKTAAASVTPGSTLTYTITAANAGPSNAQTVTLTDTISMPLASFTPPAGWTCTTPAAGATGLISCSNPTFASGGSAVFTLTVTVPAATALGTSVTNTAQIASSITDPSGTNNSSTATTSVQSPATLSAVKTITAGQPVVGSSVTYTVVITNAGPAMQFDNPGDEMEDQLPGSLTLISANATSGTAVADVPNNRVTWNGSLPNGGSVTVTIVAQLNSVSAANQATVRYDADGNGTNESSSPSNVAAFTLSPATVTVSKTITSGTPVVGTTVTYSVVLTNSGPSAQLDNPGAEMEDQLPSGLTLISASATSGTAVADVPNNRVTWNGSIPNGGSVTVTIVAQLNSVTAANQATARYDADGNGTNESSSSSNVAAFTLSPATVSVDKTIASGTPVAGTNVTYSVVLTNSGPSAQLDNPGAEMEDQLLPGLTLISATATSGTAVADVPNNRVTWNGTIASGGSVTITITARLDNSAATNQATVHYDADGNGVNESSATSPAVGFEIPIPSLSMLMLVALAATLAFVAARRA